jgi:hypothetical protein
MLLFRLMEHACAWSFLLERQRGDDLPLEDTTMRKIAAGVIGFLALCALPLLAQSAGNDTLSALLVEVRLLRQALERSTTAPRVQLLGTRLTVQNARVQSAIRDHEAARAALQQVTSAVANFTRELETFTQEHDRGSGTPERQRGLEQTIALLKQQLAAANEAEPQRRAREAELAAAVAEEQNQWLLLNRRLDEIERDVPR